MKDTKLIMKELFTEAKECLIISTPLFISYIAQLSTTFTDTVMMGLLDSQALASGAIGGTVFWTILVFCIGIVSSVSPLVAEAHGAEKPEVVGIVAVQGLLMALVLSILSMIPIWFAKPFLLHLGQVESTVIAAETYLHAIVWGFPATLAFAVLNNFVAAVSRPRIIIVITVCGILLNIVANYIFMFGKLGVRPLGLAGIGWASTLVYWTSFIVMALYILVRKEFRSYNTHQNLYCFDKLIFWQIFNIGLPNGIVYVLQTGLFAVITLLMGSLGTQVLAAHKIVVQMVNLTFTVTEGISNATTIRVGQFVGSGDSRRMKMAVYAGIILSIIFMGIMAVLFWSFPTAIASLFLDANVLENSTVLQLIISLLSVAAIFQVFDGVQNVASGALIGIKDTRALMFISLFSYWGVGITSGYVLGIWMQLGGVGIWLGLALGLATSGILLIWRFQHQVVRG
jgi:MATE family multidrug resistance protein